MQDYHDVLKNKNHEQTQCNPKTTLYSSSNAPVVMVHEMLCTTLHNATSSCRGTGVRPGVFRYDTADTIVLPGRTKIPVSAHQCLLCCAAPPFPADAPLTPVDKQNFPHDTLACFISPASKPILTATHMPQMRPTLLLLRHGSLRRESLRGIIQNIIQERTRRPSTSSRRAQTKRALTVIMTPDSSHRRCHAGNETRRLRRCPANLTGLVTRREVGQADRMAVSLVRR